MRSFSSPSSIVSQRILPPSASFEFLKSQAKEELTKMRTGEPEARLAQAQHRLAKEYGFASWPKLKRHVGVVPPAKEKAEDLRDALRALRAGKPVILFDDASRENEGDFVFAAEKITAEAVNFLTKFARGTLCLSLPGATADRLGLRRLAAEGQETLIDPMLPAFTASIDAREGITTGVSAADRAKTILAAIDADATPASVRSPGHIFPLRAAAGGLKARQGHTEGSLALMERAGLSPAAVICEILNDDGSMARFDDLQSVAKAHGVSLVSMTQLMK